MNTFNLFKQIDEELEEKIGLNISDYFLNYDTDIEKKEIYGQLDNYKFTFDIITRNIKSIQNLETGEYVKISLE